MRGVIHGRLMSNQQFSSDTLYCMILSFFCPSITIARCTFDSLPHRTNLLVLALYYHCLSYVSIVHHPSDPYAQDPVTIDVNAIHILGFESHCQPHGCNASTHSHLVFSKL